MPNIFSFMYRGIKTAKEKRSKEKKNKFCHGYGSKISVVWSKKKKYLSLGSSEWCRGGGRRGLCYAVGSSEKEKIKKIAFSRTRNKKDKKMVHFFKEGYLCLEGHYWKR
jgi:hypothetical protein